MEREELLEHITDGWWYWNIETGKEYFSSNFKKTLGYEDHELANHQDTWQRLIYNEDMPIVTAAINEAIDSGEPFRVDVRYHHKNGSTIWVICRGIVVRRNKDGKAIRMAGTHTNITHLKRAEQYLQHGLQVLDVIEPYGGDIEQVEGIEKLSIILDKQIDKLKRRMGEQDG